MPRTNYVEEALCHIERIRFMIKDFDLKYSSMEETLYFCAFLVADDCLPMYRAMHNRELYAVIEDFIQGKVDIARLEEEFNKDGGE